MSNLLADDACEVQAVDAGKVAAVRQRLDDQEAVRLADLFKLLGDPTRTRILHALLEAGELCVSDISETVGAPESTVSHATGAMDGWSTTPSTIRTCGSCSTCL